jgi:hypothetical protein
MPRQCALKTTLFKQHSGRHLVLSTDIFPERPSRDAPSLFSREARNLAWYTVFWSWLQQFLRLIIHIVVAHFLFGTLPLVVESHSFLVFALLLGKEHVSCNHNVKQGVYHIHIFELLSLLRCSGTIISFALEPDSRQMTLIIYDITCVDDLPIVSPTFAMNRYASKIPVEALTHSYRSATSTWSSRSVHRRGRNHRLPISR